MPNGNQTRLFAAGAVFIVALGVLLPHVSEPFDFKDISTPATAYFSRFVRNWDRLGFVATKGAPWFRVFPVVDGTLSPSQSTFIYHHHPVLLFWTEYALVRVLGYGEAAFRSPTVAATALTAAVIAWWLASESLLLAAAAAALFLSMPMTFSQALSGNYDPCVTACLALALALHGALRRSSVAAHALAALPIVFACGFDWAGYFVVPAVCALELIRPRDDRRFVRTALVFGIPATIALVVHLALAVSWFGSPARAIAEFVDVGKASTVGAAVAADAQPWIFDQAAKLAAGFTPIISVLAFLALPEVVGLVRRGDATARGAAALWFVALAQVLLFRTHARIHSFWWAHGTAPIALGTVLMLRTVGTRTLGKHGPVAAAVAALALAGIAGASTWNMHSERAHDSPKTLGAEFNALAGPNDVLVVSRLLDNTAFYVEAWPVEMLDMPGPEFYEGVRTLIDLHQLRSRRAVAVVHDADAIGFDGAGLARLRRVCRVEHFDRAALAARHPVLAGAFGSGAWILTYE